MKFLLGIMLIIIFSAIGEYFLPWWMIAVVSFLVSLFTAQHPGRSFLMGFLGIAIFWLATCVILDAANSHILSTRMAGVFHLPDHTLFILVTTLVGALVGGLSAWAGALVRSSSSLLSS
jgi:hypothetical protein